jgi:tetratricopeptide (TPR) repeat protein
MTVEQAPELTTYAWDPAPLLVKRYDDALELLPTRRDERVAWADHLAAAVSPRLPATADRLSELALALAPEDSIATERLAREQLSDVASGDAAPWCQGERRGACLSAAIARTARLSALRPNSCDGYDLHARLLFENGDVDAALRSLRAAADTVADRVSCYRALADLGNLAHSDATVTFALDRISHAGCSDTSECLANLKYVAGRETDRGNYRSALSYLLRARAASPPDDALLQDIAVVAAKVGLHVEALRAYDALAQRHPGDARWREAVAAEKAELMSGGAP